MRTRARACLCVSVLLGKILKFCVFQVKTWAGLVLVKMFELEGDGRGYSTERFD